MSEDVVMRERIACELLGIAALEPGGFAPCPGMRHHSKGNGPRDFRVMLEGAATGFCFHGSCADEVEAFNLELRRRIWLAEHGTRTVPPVDWGRVAAEPRVVDKTRPPFSYERLASEVRKADAAVKDMSAEWLVAHSPVPISRGMRGVGADFLDQLYQPNEKVLVFTKFESQGQFAHEIGKGSWRLSPDRGGVKVASELPTGGPDGVWYLCNPVTGGWRINNSAVGHDGKPKWGRRHGSCVTAWRYMVLECDHQERACPCKDCDGRDNPGLYEMWLKLLVVLPLPVVAIYTSGGKSVHALVRDERRSKAEWDAYRKIYVKWLGQVGADPAAMTGVRLTRLPGCLRGDRLQELLWLDPDATEEPIIKRMQKL